MTPLIVNPARQETRRHSRSMASWVSGRQVRERERLKSKPVLKAITGHFLIYRIKQWRCRVSGPRSSRRLRTTSKNVSRWLQLSRNKNRPSVKNKVRQWAQLTTKSWWNMSTKTTLQASWRNHSYTIWNGSIVTSTKLSQKILCLSDLEYSNWCGLNLNYNDHNINN